MKRRNFSGTKSINIQGVAGRSRNSEKINFNVTSVSDEDEVSIVSIDIGQPCKRVPNKNCVNGTSNIIKYNNNIKITGLNNSNWKSHCTEEYIEPECKKSKLEVPFIYKEVLQDKSNENIRGVCHLRHSGFQRKMFKSPTILRNNNHFKATADNKKPGELNSISCQTEKYQLLSIYNIKNNDKAIEFYTGLQTYEKFLHVFKSLGSDAYDLRYYYYEQAVNLAILDQFFMTLILLRQHKSHYELSILFDVTLKDIKNIFITWIRFMKLEWSNIKFPPSYNIEMKEINSSKVNAMVQEKDSNIEIEYSSKDSNMNEAVYKHSRAISDRSKSFKKVYKILNGPQNYIESHLMNDVTFVCHALCYFKAKRIPHWEQNKA